MTSTLRPQIIDLSHPLNSAISIYPGDPTYTCTPFLTIQTDGCAVKSLTLGTHTGTHIDAPAHFIADGKTIDQIPLSDLIRTVRTKPGVEVGGPGVIVIDVAYKKQREQITWDDDILPQLKSRFRDSSGDILANLRGSFLFFKTDWSNHWSTPTYFSHPYLTPATARQIIDAGVKLVGVDAFSVDETPYEGVGGELGYGVHEILLGAGVFIVENLTNLGLLGEALGGSEEEQKGVVEEWVVCVAPLNVESGDGAPVRAYAAKRATAL